MLDQQQGAERETRDDRRGAPLYRRPMPGGGYVEVELDIQSADAPDAPDRMLRGRIVMERRADPSRRYGHDAPIVAELRGDDRDQLVADLFQLAQDNAALARNLMRLHAARQHAD